MAAGSLLWPRGFSENLHSLALVISRQPWRRTLPFWEKTVTAFLSTRMRQLWFAEGSYSHQVMVEVRHDVAADVRHLWKWDVAGG